MIQAYHSQQETVRRARITIAATLFVAALTSLMFVVRLFLEGWKSKTLWLLAIGATIFFTSPFLVRMTRRLIFSQAILLCFGFSVIFIRILSTGGISSPVALWMTLVPVIMVIMVSPRAGLISLFSCLAGLFLILKADVIGLPLNDLVSSPVVSYSVLAILNLLLTFVVLFFEKE